MMKYRALSVAAVVLATTLALTACSSSGGMGDMPGMGGGGSSPESSAAAADFNDADVAFAQMMIPHHQGAIEMADIVLAKDGIDQRVVDLANQIKDAQGPEITQLQQWLKDWGADSDMSGMDSSMPAMDMSDLESSSGVDAARAFLEQMKVHHQGAITMAQTELDTGTNPDAKKMAASIVSSQTAEIATIDDILASL